MKEVDYEKWLVLVVGAGLLVSIGWSAGAAQTQAVGRRAFANQIGTSLMIVGHADTVQVEGAISTYKGNLQLSEPNGRLEVRAAEATYDANTKSFTLIGSVRIVQRDVR